jgi:SAM-dependent methyltransferase
MMPDEDRERLRRTFNGVAGSYDRIRPDYPHELFDDLIAIAGLVRGDHLVEVGSGTGKAALPLARRGFRITGIEPGLDLAAVARRNLAGLDTEIIGERFEEWRARPGDEAALVYSATAWHWIDPAVRYRRAWEVLHPGGHLAFWSAQHVFPCGGDPFFRATQSGATGEPPCTWAAAWTSARPGPTGRDLIRRDRARRKRERGRRGQVPDG